VNASDPSPGWARVQLADYCGVVGRGNISSRQAPGSENGCSAMALGAARVGPELVEGTTDESQMNRAHHFWVAMGCLEQGAAA